MAQPLRVRDDSGVIIRIGSRLEEEAESHSAKQAFAAVGGGAIMSRRG